MPKRSSKRLVTAIIFTLQCIGISLLLFAGYLLYERAMPNQFPEFRASNKSEASFHTELATGSAELVRLTIPSIEITLPATTAKQAADGEWMAQRTGVATIQNQFGGHILYGHNWQSILGKLGNVRVSDTIIAEFFSKNTNTEANAKTSSKNSIVTYRVVAIHVVDPSQTQLLESIKGNMLLIYTCTGFLDRQRLAVVAEKIDHALQ